MLNSLIVLLSVSKLYHGFSMWICFFVCETGSICFLGIVIITATTYQKLGERSSKSRQKCQKAGETTQK